MSSGFLLADTLAQSLRQPYHQGDRNITVLYLVEGFMIGEYRIMLKRNFDTACWVPPTGRRGSHSIYYGDRMLDRVIDMYCKNLGLSMPETEIFVEQVKAEIDAAKTATVSAKPGPVIPPLTRVFNLRLEWLQNTVTTAQWADFVEMLVQAVASYGRHEREHARHTAQDLKQINKDLAVLKIPFRYFNLFEDARIEHRSRVDMGGRFDWTVFEELAPMSSASNILLRCIQLEGEPDEEALASEALCGRGGRSVSEVAASVATYYQRTCLTPSSEHLYVIIQEFLEEFREELPQESKKKRGKGGGKSEGTGAPAEDDYLDDFPEDDGPAEDAGDLTIAAEAAEKGDDFFDEFEDDAEVVGGTDAEGKAAEAKAKAANKPTDPPPTVCGGGGKGAPESITPTESGGRATQDDFLARRPGNIDAAYQKRVDHLTAMLMQLFKVHSLPAATENPGHRVSARHLVRGELRFIHKKVFGGKGKRKFSVIYDCSGSMDGRPDREGKLLLLALNNLAKRGYLEGTLVLSGYVHNRPGWLSYPFPVKDELILRIKPDHSSEGLQSSLKDNLKHIKGMDDVFVYTDANICDSPLNREFFAGHRIWPVGLYVGPEDDAKEMQKHFPQNIIKPTIEELVATMLTRNRRTVG